VLPPLGAFLGEMSHVGRASGRHLRTEGRQEVVVALERRSVVELVVGPQRQMQSISSDLCAHAPVVDERFYEFWGFP
jgi:hypothetical protein